MTVNIAEDFTIIASEPMPKNVIETYKKKLESHKIAANQSIFNRHDTRGKIATTSNQLGQDQEQQQTQQQQQHIEYILYI